MNKTVPKGAAKLLDFIASYEAPQGYTTVYGNNQRKLARPITSLTLDEVIAQGAVWTKAFGSSACGRYQFMRDTLKGLKIELKLTGKETFNPDFQDFLGFHLLIRRGWYAFASGKLSIAGFGLKLAQEWASFPVLTNCQGAHRGVLRGQSYYAGDGKNKALVPASKVEDTLTAILEDKPSQEPVQAPQATPELPTMPKNTDGAPEAPMSPTEPMGFLAAIVKLILKLFGR